MGAPHVPSPPDRRGEARGEPIRVLWLIKGLGPGGAERLLALSAELRDRTRFRVRAAFLLPHKVTLVPDLEAADVPVSCLGRTRLVDVRWLWAIRRSLVADPVDVVHAHSPVAAVAARLVLRTMPRRVRPLMVTTDHSLWTGRVRATRWADTLTGGLDDATLAVSAAVRASMPARLGRRTEVMIYGIDVAEVRSHLGARSEVRAELGIGPDELVVVTVANFRWVKAYPDLLAAARQVADARPGVRFVVVGQGPLESEVRDLHDRLGLGERMLVLGYRADALRVMAAADVFCLSSTHEGLPVALMEALTLGLPVVVTDVGGVREIVDDGREGLLLEPGRPEVLAASLISLLDDPDRRAAMAVAAAERGDSLSIAAAVRRTESIYERLVGGNR